MKRKRFFSILIFAIGLAIIAWGMYQLLPALRLQALHAANAVGAKDCVVGFLADDNREVIQEANDLVLAGGSTYLPALLRGMENRDSRIRNMCAFALGRLGAAANEGIEILKAHMKSDGNEVVRSLCIKPSPASAATTRQCWLKWLACMKRAVPMGGTGHRCPRLARPKRSPADTGASVKRR